jgi:hypothetical protein
MIQLKRVFPECDADTLLVELILQRGTPMHSHGITKVANAIVKYDHAAHFIIGLIDTDKFKNDENIPNIKKFSEEVDNRIETEGLLIKKIPGTNKHVIRIHPDFEPWLWNIASECDLNPADAEYGFDTYETFRNASKRYGIRNDQRFKKFVNAIVMQNPPAIQTLRNWLEKVFE